VLSIRGCRIRAESTDISKVIRMTTAPTKPTRRSASARSRAGGSGTRRRPRRWFHETGVTFLSRTAMQPGGFEHDSFAC